MSEFEVKERLAHSVFVEMMREAGYQVRKIDYEGALQELVNVKDEGYKLYIADIKEHNHDFLLLDGNSPLMLQVYFSEKKVNPKDYDFPEYLGGVLLIFITPFEPFFQIGVVRDFCNEGVLYPLSENPLFVVPSEIVNKYGTVIAKRLK